MEFCLQSQVLQNDGGCISAAGPHDAATGMRCGTTEIQVVDRSSVIGPTDQRTRRPQLVQVHRSLHDIAAGQSIGPLKIQRRHRMGEQDLVANVGGKFLERINARFNPALFFFVPIAPARKFVGGVLNEDRHLMLSRRCDRVIHIRRDRHLPNRCAAVITVDGFLIGSFDESDVWRDMNGAVEKPGIDTKIGQRVKRQIDLSTCRGVIDVLG